MIFPLILILILLLYVQLVNSIMFVPRAKFSIRRRGQNPLDTLMTCICPSIYGENITINKRKNEIHEIHENVTESCECGPYQQEPHDWLIILLVTVFIAAMFNTLYSNRNFNH